MVSRHSLRATECFYLFKGAYLFREWAWWLIAISVQYDCGLVLLARCDFGFDLVSQSCCWIAVSYNFVVTSDAASSVRSSALASRINDHVQALILPKGRRIFVQVQAA